MLNPVPVSPGYIISFGNGSEWKEFWEWIIESGFAFGVPHTYEPRCAARLTFSDESIVDWGWGMLEMYQSRSEYIDYIFTDFSTIPTQSTDMSELLQEFDELLEV